MTTSTSANPLSGRMMQVDFHNVSVSIVEKKIALREALVTEIDKNFNEDKDPVVVCDLGDVFAKHQRWVSNLPRVDPYYAVKCNPDPAILKLLVSLGIGFDCASKHELQTVLGVGANPAKVIYANPCKQASHIRYAADHNVPLMTFDNESELYKIKENFPEAKLVIRILTDVTKARCPLGLKFGVTPSSVQPLLRVARELGLDVVGVSFHVGSGCFDPDAYKSAIRSSRAVFDMAKKVGYEFKLLDLGGGFPGESEPLVSFEDVAVAINSSLDEWFPVSCGVHVIAEPGRYYVASAFACACSVVSKRAVMGNGNTNESFWYYINDGVYGSFNCVLYDHFTPKATPLFPTEEKLYPSMLWGPTCDSMDKITEDCSLPELNVGDWIAFEDMGAYTVAAGSCFNGFQRPRIRYMLESSIWARFSELLQVDGLSGGACCVAEGGPVVCNTSLCCVSSGVC